MAGVLRTAIGPASLAGRLAVRSTKEDNPMSRVREILSWYGSDNPGTLTNLARMLNHGRLAGSGKMVILPVDQGFEHGPARVLRPTRRPMIRTITTS